MKNISKYFKTLSLVAIVLIVIGVIGGIVVGSDGSDESLTTLDETVDARDVLEVVIDARNQRVHVHQISGNEARVVSSGVATDLNLVVEVVDGVLSIESRRTTRNFQIGINLGGFREIANPSTLEVYLPVAMYERIQINSINGRIEISDFNVGYLQIETTNARIDISDIDGDVNARTTNGRITFNNSTINQDVNLQTTNGQIKVNLLNQPEHAMFNLRATNGGTQIFGNNNSTQQFGDGRYEVVLQTTNGRVSVN